MEISARINPISYEKPYYRRKNESNIVRKGEKGEIFFLGGGGLGGYGGNGILARRAG